MARLLISGVGPSVVCDIGLGQTMNKLKQLDTHGSEKSTSDYVAERLVRLISVGLKEATMDSPSFRASMNYMHISILKCSHQLEQSMLMMQNYASSYHNFVQVSSEVEKVFTPYLSNDYQFISNDVSKPCVQKFLEGEKIIFESALSLLKVDDLSLANIKHLLEVEIPQYIELRTNFEKIQNKYDLISAKFMQLPKGYDPSKTREDALQLYEIRKQYIHLSMTLWISIKQLESKVCRSVTDTSDSFWGSFNKRNLGSRSSLLDVTGLSAIVKSITQLKACADLQQESTNLLIDDLHRARVNSEEGAIKMYAPSTDLKDFDPSILNNANIYLNSEENFGEKHGWVFIKSSKLNGKGDVWIKRWMFVKNGVFGFLSISQDGQYVQESDKIGVLLVSVNYLPSEDRKFCFKINSESTNLILQVETSIELKSWLTVFRNVSKIAVDENSQNALNRYSPCLNILKLTPVVAKDFELIDVIKVDAQTEKTSKLIELQLSNLKFNLSINAPLKTSMTEKLAMSHLYLSSTTIPSATTANFWGYVNWGLYFVLDDESKQLIIKNTKNLPPKSIINLRYPDYYPENLRVSDAELRSIFEVYINDDEYTLLRFNGSWSPNSSQKLFCTIYVTNKSFYVYSHTCGLISILPIPLSNFLDSEIIDTKKLDTIKFYFISGLSLKLQVFTENLNLVNSKFNLILESMKSNKSKNLQSIVSKLLHLDQSSRKLSVIKQQNPVNMSLPLLANNAPGTGNKINSSNAANSDVTSLAQTTGIKAALSLNSVKTSFGNIPGISDISGENKINYTPQMNLLLSKKYRIPAKALFHILFGDESHLLQCLLPLSSKIFREDVSKHSLWRCDSKQKMTRVVWNSVFQIPCSLQRIESIRNNKYYNITQETPYLRFVFGINKKLYMRFIIYAVDSRTCKLIIYYSLGGSNNVLNWFTRKVLHQIMIFRMEALEGKVGEAIKNINNTKNRKIALAIQNFGPITKYDSDKLTKEEQMFDKVVNYVPLQLFSSYYYEKINFEIERLLIRFIKTISRIIRSFVNFFNTNLVLILLFGFSILLNLFLLGRSGRSYWRESNINKRMNMLIGDHYLMERSIGMDEINELIYPNSTDLSYVKGGSECYWEFLKSEDLLDLNKFSKIESGDEITNVDEINLFKGKRELNLSKRLNGLRIERIDLLTKLNLLNYVEREFILKEWKNWISSEISNCGRVKATVPKSYEQIKDYCNEVELEMINLYQNLL